MPDRANKNILIALSFNRSPSSNIFLEKETKITKTILGRILRFCPMIHWSSPEF